MSFQFELGKIYENFFMRDLTYIFGGFLILWSLRYSFKDADVFRYLFYNLDIGEMEWFKLIIVFAVSYFVGLIVKESLTNDRILDSETLRCKCLKKLCENRWFSTHVPYYLEKNFGYERYKFFYYLAEIQEVYKNDAVNRLERVLYFLHIGASIGIASLVSCFILGVALIIRLPCVRVFLLRIGCYVEPRYDWCGCLIYFIIMFIVFLVCLKENRWKMIQYINFFVKLHKNRNFYYNETIERDTKTKDC